jgi:ABC-type transport system involved in multi-copper enzyme maturation permease subunit
MLPGPVFNVELLTLPRRGRYYLLRTIYGLLLLILIWQNDPMISQRFGVTEPGEISIQQLAGLGQTLFAVFAYTQSLVVLLITPALVAGVIADERRRKTLDYLLSSRLTSAEIVLGKLAARLLSVGTFLAMGLPIVVMLSFFGGVDPNGVFLFFAATASTTVFLAALSILVSTFAKRPRDAVVTTYMLELLWLFVPAIASWAFPAIGGTWGALYEWMRVVNEWVGLSSPFYVLSHFSSPITGALASIESATFWMIGLQLALSTFFVALAVLWLRPGFRREGSTAPRSGRFRGLFKARRLLPRPRCGDAPMLWKELHVARSSRMTRVVATLALLILALLVGYTTCVLVGEAFRDLLTWGYFEDDVHFSRAKLNAWLRFLMTLIAAFMLLWVASAASSGLTSEREDDTWISLIVTPLSAGEIIVAKMLGALWRVRVLGLIWVGFLLMGLALGAIHPLGGVAATIVTATYLAFGCALGMFYSLRARTSARAVAATIGSLIILNGVYLIAVLPFGMNTPLWAIGVTPFVEAASLMSNRDVYLLFDAPRRDMLDIVLTCVASVVVYGAGTLVLSSMTFLMFDDVLDRPGPGGEGPLLHPLADARVDDRPGEAQGADPVE